MKVTTGVTDCNDEMNLSNYINFELYQLIEDQALIPVLIYKFNSI